MKCSIRDSEINYEDIGSGRPVIMLHGFGLDHRVMLGCMEPILKRREGWRRIYPDLPGMGGTEARDWIADSDGMLDVVLEFIDAVVPGEDFVLAGESYGGYLTLGALHRRAGSVKGLLLICPVLVPDHPKRTLPRHATIFKEPGLGVGSSEEEQMFKSMAVVRDSRHWKRFQEEILPGAGQRMVDSWRPSRGRGIPSPSMYPGSPSLDPLWSSSGGRTPWWASGMPYRSWTTSPGELSPSSIVPATISRSSRRAYSMHWSGNGSTELRPRRHDRRCYLDLRSIGLTLMTRFPICDYDEDVILII